MKDSLTMGRATLVGPEGREVGGWHGNFVAQGGRRSILGVYYRGEPNPPKYLALLLTPATVDSTAADLDELGYSPGAGYTRQLLPPASDPVSVGPAEDEVVASVTFGPAVVEWPDVVGVAILAGPGDSAIFVGAIPLAPTRVRAGQTLEFELALGASDPARSLPL